MGYRRQGPFGEMGHGLCRIDFAREFDTTVRPLRTAQEPPRPEGREGHLQAIAGTDGATALTQQANAPAPPPAERAGDGDPDAVPNGVREGVPMEAWGAVALSRHAPQGEGRDTGPDGPAHRPAARNRPRL